MRKRLFEEFNYEFAVDFRYRTQYNWDIAY